MDVVLNPIFVKEGVEYPFEGLHPDQHGARRGANYEFRFIVDTLRYYFGSDVDFDDEGTKIKIKLSDAQKKVVQTIKEDTNEYPVKYGRSHLKFTIDG